MALRRKPVKDDLSGDEIRTYEGANYRLPSIGRRSKAGGKEPFGGLVAPPALERGRGRCNSAKNWRGLPLGEIALTAYFMQEIRSYFKYDSCIFYVSDLLPGAKTRRPSFPRHERVYPHGVIP